MSAGQWVCCALLVVSGAMIGHGWRELLDWVTNYRGWWYED